jgi:O-antigen/teichoic acid export membrane protein
VTAGGTIAGFLVRFASNAFFARQMTPEEYGAWGFAAVWASLAALPYALSLPTAVLQADAGTPRLLGSVVRLGVKLAAVVMVLSALGALVVWQLQGAVVAQCFLALALGQLGDLGCQGARVELDRAALCRPAAIPDGDH